MRFKEKMGGFKGVLCCSTSPGTALGNCHCCHVTLPSRSGGIITLPFRLYNHINLVGWLRTFTKRFRCGTSKIVLPNRSCNFNSKSWPDFSFSLVLSCHSGDYLPFLLAGVWRSAACLPYTMLPIKQLPRFGFS